MAFTAKRLEPEELKASLEMIDNLGVRAALEDHIQMLELEISTIHRRAVNFWKEIEYAQQAKDKVAAKLRTTQGALDNIHHSATVFSKEANLSQDAAAFKLIAERADKALKDTSL